MRGKAHFQQALFQHLGITHACAGKSFTAYQVQDEYRDHPRMCGEKPVCLS